MFHQNWLKEHMLAKAKGGSLKLPPEAEESPGLLKRQGLGPQLNAATKLPTPQSVTKPATPPAPAPPWHFVPAQPQPTQPTACPAPVQQEQLHRNAPAAVQGLLPPTPALAGLPPPMPEHYQVQAAPPLRSSADTFGTPWPWQGRHLHFYAVMCKDDVEIRAAPTYADDARVGHFLHPGQVVVVDERKLVNSTSFLHLADERGWVFETKDRLLVLTEVQEFEKGLWHYSVICQEDVETRMSPTYSDDARTGVVLMSGDCIAVDERCTVAGARFLKLADGRGWVFETKDRLLVMSEVRAKEKEARDFARGLWHYTVVCDDDVEIRAAPTYSDEARTGLTVHPGDCVAVDERCRVNATWFLRLSDGRGWLFETKDSRRIMIQLR